MRTGNVEDQVVVVSTDIEEPTDPVAVREVRADNMGMVTQALTSEKIRHGR